MRKHIVKLGMVIAVLILAFSAHAQDAKAKGVTIAVVGPFSGPVANFGDQMKNGVVQATKDINAAGGVLGQKLVIKFFDDACDPKQAVTVANQVIAERIPVVIGPFCSGSGIPASRIYAEEGTLMITPAATNPKLTAQGFKNIFRMIGTDDLQGQAIAKYVLSHFTGKNIAMVDDKQTFSRGLVEVVAKALDAAGAKITLREQVNAGEKDYTSLVTRLKKEKIEVLIYGGYQNEAGLIKRQMSDQGVNAVMIGGDAISSVDFWAITGAAGEGTLYTAPPDLTKISGNEKLLAAFKAAKLPADGYTLYSYAALKLWVDAVNKIGSAEPSKVAAEFRAAPHDTPLGNIAFDEKGDIRDAAYAVYQFRKGKTEQVE